MNYGLGLTILLLVQKYYGDRCAHLRMHTILRTCIQYTIRYYTGTIPVLTVLLLRSFMRPPTIHKKYLGSIRSTPLSNEIYTFTVECCYRPTICSSSSFIQDTATVQLNYSTTTAHCIIDRNGVYPLQTFDESGAY